MSPQPEPGCSLLPIAAEEAEGARGRDGRGGLLPQLRRLPSSRLLVVGETVAGHRGGTGERAAAAGCSFRRLTSRGHRTKLVVVRTGRAQTLPGSSPLRPTWRNHPLRVRTVSGPRLLLWIGWIFALRVLELAGKRHPGPFQEAGSAPTLPESGGLVNYWI